MFCGILLNLALAGDYLYFLIHIQVCKAFRQNCQSSLNRLTILAISKTQLQHMRFHGLLNI